VLFNGWEEIDFNEGEGMREEGKRDILVKHMCSSRK